MALEKALITNMAVNNEKTFVMFNPEQYTVNRSNNFAQAIVPGRWAPLLQFVNGETQTLEMELFVDTFELGGDVRNEVCKIIRLMDINKDLHAPPPLLFTWASLSFTCVLVRANQRFIMFRPDGTPVRARLQVTFNEFSNNDLEAKEIKCETADYSKMYVVHQGETLSGIATKVYENPLLWRPIAIQNGIDNPRALTIGQQLLIPQLPFRDPETGEVM